MLEKCQWSVIVNVSDIYLVFETYMFGFAIISKTGKTCKTLWFDLSNMEIPLIITFEIDIWLSISIHFINLLWFII